MKHFATQEWVDFVNHVASNDQQEAMQKHLATGCKRCTETVSLWQKVSKTAAVEVSYQPPPDSVRLAKAAFVTSGLAQTKKESKGLIEVLFDSFQQPALAGARSVVIGTRQMLYRADPFQIDIQIEPKLGSNRLVITGQLLDLSHPGVIGRDIQVTLSNHRGSTVLAATNQFGEFSGEVENSGDLELSIPGEGEKPIVISLRNALGNLQGGKS
ncbi:MAG TPA: hypothetical protein VFF95_00175 [Candidatus Binatus sp.]|nr:hypothetical protein [Candidatus Binatus sp.]